ncbi:cell division protein FtsA, partial [Caulobacter sp. 17J65-9]|nr:cell division protein FtsA [Caulobacter sp. 17J65-9]
PHLADAAAGPAFCSAAGVLLRAAYGPREAVSTRKLMAGKVGPKDAPQAPQSGGVLSRAAGWLKENL